MSGVDIDESTINDQSFCHTEVIPPPRVDVIPPPPNQCELPNEDLPFSSIRIPIQTWQARIQDVGGSKELLPAKTYLGKQIPPYGPTKVYYYDLACIAIDYIASMKEAKGRPRGFEFGGGALGSRPGSDQRRKRRGGHDSPKKFTPLC